MIFFKYFFIIFIDFLTIKLLLIPWSYCCIILKWEYCRKAVVALMQCSRTSSKSIGSQFHSAKMLISIKKQYLNNETLLCIGGKMSFTIKRMLYSSFPQTYLLNKINWYNLDTFSNLIPQVSFISNSFYDEEENISSLLSKLLEKQWLPGQFNGICGIGGIHRKS